MKTITFIFPLIFKFFLAGEQFPTSEIETAIRSSDFVGFVMLHEKDNSEGQAILIVKECFKGDATRFIVPKYEAMIDKDYPYLLIAKTSGYSITNITYPFSRVRDLSDGTIDILNKLECYSESLAVKYKESTCIREGEEICGCDNRTYANVCMLHKAGMMKFKIGKCQ